MKKEISLAIGCSLILAYFYASNLLLPYTWSRSYEDPKVKSLVEDPQLNRSSNRETKVILFWKTWNDAKLNIGSEKLRDLKCPEWNCDFQYDRKKINKADAVVFYRYAGKENAGKFQVANANQRWVSVDQEAAAHIRPLKELKFVNWTMTFHSSADVVGSYGFFIAKDDSPSSLRPNLMDYDSPTMKRYLDSLRRNHSSDMAFGSLKDPSQPRSKLAFWVSSHCPSDSKREKFIEYLQRYQEIDTYGSCGRLKCGGRRSSHTECWETLFSANYLFNFAMENVLCEEYITEKAYLPLKYGVVPIVFGGANYSRFLPPHSFINALEYSPEDLVKLLLRLRDDPHEYGRYHLWRKFWDVHREISFCELCYKLHFDKIQKSYPDLLGWRRKIEKCSKKGFPEAFPSNITIYEVESNSIDETAGHNLQSSETEKLSENSSSNKDPT